MKTDIERRTFLRLMALTGSAVAHAPWSVPFGRSMARAQSAPAASLYGKWEVRHGLPAFVYDADQSSLAAAEWDPLIAPRTRRHWLMVGNQAIRLQCANDGTVALFDETEGLRWLTAPDLRFNATPLQPSTGTGVSVIDDIDRQWGSEFALRSGVPMRTFGPTWFEVKDAHAGLNLTRTILCPEGEVPWLLVHVQLALSAAATATRTIRHTERWALRPRFLNPQTIFSEAGGIDIFAYRQADAVRRRQAELAVTFTVRPSAGALVAEEHFAAANAPGEVGEAAKHLIGQPAILVLEPLAGTPGTARHRIDVSSSPHPILEIESSIALMPGETKDLWFRFGRRDDTEVRQPDALLNASMTTLAKRLPRAAAAHASEAEQEIPWHAALLTGGVAKDRVIGGHSFDQASAYSYSMGFNGAARDPLQHALPLVYTQPDLALSVLRNTCAWATPEGELPYALDGAKQPTTLSTVYGHHFRPSDSNLWALWLAAEYAAATGDLAAFDVPLRYHPVRDTEPVPLREHLRRQYQYFTRQVGRGERGHVRVMRADWNDFAVTQSGVPEAEMVEKGSSVLNSAMAAWVLNVFGGLAERLSEAQVAADARKQADELRVLVRQAWNGRWYDRAYAPGGHVVGRTDIWLEVQPWAILCGAADQDQARLLLDSIAQGPCSASPLGARVRWPVPDDDPDISGIWYSINMTLIWAASRVLRTWAWDQWRRMTLANHAASYPSVWEGTLSGADSWNPPESRRAGRTWGYPKFPVVVAMQAFPVNNMHSHSQPLLTYLRLLGIEPTSRGTLALGQGGDFKSEVLVIDRDGHGSLQAHGAVSLETIHGPVSGGPGRISW